MRTNCSAEELEEIKAWVERYRHIHELKRRHAALTLAEQIDAASEWFERAKDDEARGPAEDIIETIGRLRRVLAKRGFI